MPNPPGKELDALYTLIREQSRRVQYLNFITGVLMKYMDDEREAQGGESKISTLLDEITDLTIELEQVWDERTDGLYERYEKLKDAQERATADPNGNGPRRRRSKRQQPSNVIPFPSRGTIGTPSR